MALLTMVLLGAVSWLFRVLFILVIPADRLPARVQASLTHLAPATMASLIAVEATATLHGGGRLDTVVVMLALSAAFVLVRRTGSLGAAITLGAGAALLLDLVLLR